MMKPTLLTTLSIAAALCSIQAAQAQEEGGNPNRWKFAPNIYKLEQPNTPRGYNAPRSNSSVRAGSVPKNMLGYDPADPMYSKPMTRIVPAIAPIAQTYVKPQLSFGNPAPQLLPQTELKAPPAYSSDFGKPLVAHQPPAISVPRTPPVAAKPAPQVAFNSNRSVNGIIRRPAVARGHSAGPAQGLPVIASYGPGGGFQRGQNLPSMGGSGSSSTANVSATLLTRTHSR